jgi:hypothetical protein
MEVVMTAKSYCILSAAVFALIALLQLTRAVMGWPVTVSSHDVPLWASGIAFVVAVVLSAIGWRAAGR